jgi:hypothetical protein
MHHADKGDKFDVDLALDDARPDDFDALMIPGGLMNPDSLRSNDDVANYRTARRILDGEHAWLESGLVAFDPLRELSAELAPREALAAGS